MVMWDQAPGALETVRAFVNTLDGESGADELTDPKALQTWLEEHALMRATHLGPADLNAARGLREALRSLMLENNGVDARDEAAVTLNRAAERGRLVPRFDTEGSVRFEAAAAGARGALGHLVGIAAAAMADGTWRRLKACRAERCGWAFYDHARNHSRTWCSMAVCGNRTKARSYRRRHAD